MRIFGYENPRIRVSRQGMVSQMQLSPDSNTLLTGMIPVDEAGEGDKVVDSYNPALSESTSPSRVLA